MSRALVVLNAGSSSLKFSLFESDGRERLELRARGRAEGIGSGAHFFVQDGAGRTIVERALDRGSAGDHAAAFALVDEWLRTELDGASPLAVGHRVVHGGRRFVRPVRVDAEVLEEIEALIPLAPLHQAHSLAAMRAILAVAPEVPQVACFDTSFHRGRPALADLLALPLELSEAGIQRYGFHGLSFEFIARQLTLVAPEVADGRVIVAHLGNGASLCALAKQKPVDATMGFTPLDGLVMGTRCGTLDAGVVLYLARARGMSTPAIEHLLYDEAGLLGLSGTSGDVRDLLADPDPRARLALDCFVYRLVREAGALASVLGGLDALVFTGGIGEHAAPIRARICAGLAWLGIELDPEANAAAHARISRMGSRTSAWVIATDEERMIAEHTLAALRG